MGDVADILGFAESKESALTAEANKILSIGEKCKPLTGKVKKPKGMSREVFGLIGQDTIVSSLQPAVPVASVFKNKRNQRNRWAWAPLFPDTNKSAFATKNNPELHHWLKADLQNCEYPYFKFNIQIDRVHFTDEEYDSHLSNEKWTQSESEYLLDLCYKYDLRWPVIYDRYCLQPQRRPEEIQERFYAMVSAVQSARSAQQEIASKMDKVPFINIEIEKNRRIQQELLFHKTKQEAQEEIEAKEELKVVETALKKSRKSTKVVDKVSKTDSAATSSSTMFVPQMGNFDAADFSYSVPGKPGLHSSRLLAAEYNTNLSRNLLKKLSCLLKELGLPEKMLPTKTICDMYDQVRRNGITLLSLQNIISKKEKEIAGLRSKNATAVVSSVTTADIVKLEPGGSAVSLGSSKQVIAPVDTVPFQTDSQQSDSAAIVQPNTKKSQKRKKSVESGQDAVNTTDANISAANNTAVTTSPQKVHSKKSKAPSILATTPPTLL